MPFPSINRLVPKVVLPAISFEHVSLRVNHLHLLKGRIFLDISFLHVAFNPLAPNTYFERQSFPSSGTAAISFQEFGIGTLSDSVLVFSNI